MALVESDFRPGIELLQPAELIGYELTLARERLHEFFNNPVRNNSGAVEEYGVAMSGYLNVLQKCWFEQGDEIKYSIIEDLPKRIKAEAEMFFGSIEPIEDVVSRLDWYIGDETGQDYKRRGISQYPRATTLTLLDVFDEYR